MPQLAAARCLALACPACMTADLAEACSEFTTTIVNSADLIPTFSHSQMDRLRAEVMGSSWREEWRAELARSRLFRTVNSAVETVGQARGRAR